MKYRICRVQRFNVGWAFTLPLDTLVFDTVKEAYERLQKRGIINFGDNSFWVQEISDDGKFSEFPKPLPGLDVPRSGAPLPIYVEQSEPEEEPEPYNAIHINRMQNGVTAENSAPSWLPSWGYEKPIIPGADERESVVTQAPWANRRMEVTNGGNITVTNERPTVDSCKKPEAV